MASRVIKIIFFSSIALIIAGTGAGTAISGTSITSPKPRIDAQVPADFETATFSLG
jgi:hypothetical protein